MGGFQEKTSGNKTWRRVSGMKLLPRKDSPFILLLLLLLFYFSSAFSPPALHRSVGSAVPNWELEIGVGVTGSRWDAKSWGLATGVGSAGPQPPERMPERMPEETGETVQMGAGTNFGTRLGLCWACVKQHGVSQFYRRQASGKNWRTLSWTRTCSHTMVFEFDDTGVSHRPACHFSQRASNPI